MNTDTKNSHRGLKATTSARANEDFINSNVGNNVANFEFGRPKPSIDSTERDAEEMALEMTQQILDNLCDCECEGYADYADAIELHLTEHLHLQGYYDFMYLSAYDVEDCDDVFTCMCNTELLIVAKKMFSRDGNFPWSNLFQVFETAIVPVNDLLDLARDFEHESRVESTQ